MSLADVAIVVPTLGRSHKLRRFAAPIWENTPEGSYEIVFVVDADDVKTHKVVERLGAKMVVHDGTYPQKVNAGIKATDTPLVFITNDDVIFHPGWYEAAGAQLENGTGVVGTNDLHNGSVLKGEYATQLLVTRDYVNRGTIDDPSVVYHPGYHHNFCDCEFSETAQHRGQWAMAFDSHVEHIHPDHGLRKYDATDRKGELQYREEDLALFEARRSLWGR
jgi:glycosyltransferase involved in cell wall biosynthesis